MSSEGNSIERLKYKFCSEPPFDRAIQSLHSCAQLGHIPGVSIFRPWKRCLSSPTSGEVSSVTKRSLFSGPTTGERYLPKLFQREFVLTDEQFTVGK
jgi:hypothetical protein